uniref:ATM interactor isoform X2 n=1 Tax=Tursiops truncatus TaxID=9739 RepID=A0A2U4BSN8_TURTR|nr:ATM interactor isoform X2 [Tursiops truncatus]
MAASEATVAAAAAAAAAGPTALALGAAAVPAAGRGAAAAPGPWDPPGRLRGSRPRPTAARQQPAGAAPPARELIQPSVSELSRAVRTNILCTVRGCGKILPNSPALNMHLVKSHRLQDGIVNPTIRKDLKTVPKFYCCPIEGCPRGPDRPFSQFSLVKQHFMKMHAEKKHKCSKCSNSYGTEWDLKRHAEDCGKTFQCTCGCPYASRTALQSHIYRTGHEIPAEHRDPPSKKRKMENCLHNQKLSSKTVESLSNQATPRPDAQELETSEIKLVASFEDSCSSNARKQTLPTPPSSKVTSSIAAQTDVFIDASFQSGGISRETQTSGMQSPTDDRVQMDQAVMCGDIFESVHSSYGVSTDSIISSSLVAETVTHGLLPQNHPKTLNQDIEKSAPIINFSAQNNSILSSQNMTDNQTQTIDLLSDIENILSSNLPGQTLDNRSLLSDTNTGPDTQLPSGPAQNPAIDFDIEEFFSASNIQTQTEESELSTMTTEPVLESLDIETQTDFFLADACAQSYSCRGNSNFLALEMFDTQTQTDLNFFLDSSPHLPLGSILKHSSFSMSTDSSDTETQTEGISTAKNLPALESKVQLNSAETQTMNSGFETLGSLFFTSNETQTAMDDFLLADLAWNTMESQFSSVETQTCAELHPVSNF